MSEPAASELHLPSTFRALRHKNFRLFFLGQSVSLIGTWMQTIALQWLVYRLTGSAAMLATINLLTALPLAPVALWGGSLADRFPKRTILLITQTTMMVVAFLLALLVWTDVVEVWQVMVLAVISGAASAINVPVQQAFLLEMIADKEDLTNAIGLNSTLTSAARAIGPALAGVAVAAVGEAAAFSLNGVTFIAILVCLMLMRLPASPRLRNQPKLTSHLWEAVRYVWGQKTLMIILSLVAVSAFLSRPYVVLLPVFAQDVLSESAQPLVDLVCSGSSALLDCESPDALTYGLLMAAMGLGTVIGALFVAALPTNTRRGWLLTLTTLSFSALLVAMALSRSFVFTSLLLVGIGFSFIAQTALANTMIQLTVPDELRGRTMSFYSITVLGMIRVGGMQAGVMADTFGAPLAVAAGALICLAYVLLVAWRYPILRRTV